MGAILHQEMADAIEIVDVEGHTYRLTAIQRRDELFNRLASLGQQVLTFCRLVRVELISSAAMGDCLNRLIHAFLCNSLHAYTLSTVIDD